MIAMALKEKEIAELSERLGNPLVTIDQYLPPRNLESAHYDG